MEGDVGVRGVAVVTGASSGIGRAFAEHYAREGHPLLLVARREDRLRVLAVRLSGEHGVEVGYTVADLATEEGMRTVRDAVDGVRALVIVVLNAGFGAAGRVAELSRERQTRMVVVNCAAVVDLAAHVLPRLVTQRNGTIIVMSSAAAHLPIPETAVYAATKAFDLHFAEALADELRGSGVRAIASCPGPVPTEFGAVAGISAASWLPPYTPDRVVRDTVRALADGRVRVAAGPTAMITTVAARILPRRLVVWAAGEVHRRALHATHGEGSHHGP